MLLFHLLLHISFVFAAHNEESEEKDCKQDGISTRETGKNPCRYDEECSAKFGNFSYCYDNVCCKAVETTDLFNKLEFKGRKSEDSDNLCNKNEECESDTEKFPDVICIYDRNEDEKICARTGRPPIGVYHVEPETVGYKNCYSDNDCTDNPNTKCFFSIEGNRCGTLDYCDDLDDVKTKNVSILTPFMIHKEGTNRKGVKVPCFEPFMSYTAFLFAATDNKDFNKFYQKNQHAHNVMQFGFDPCKKNGDCAKSSFCDYQYKHFYDNQHDEKYCTPNPFSAIKYIKPVLKADLVGLIFCNNSADCQKEDPSGFCYVINKRKPYISVCVQLKICGGEIPASLASEGQKCFDDDDCVNQGVSTENDSYKYLSKCKDVRYEMNQSFIVGNVVRKLDTRVCCYVEQNLDYCVVGNVQMPLKQCAHNNDCAAGHWCDKERRYCCRNTKESFRVCPDNVTISLLEPACIDDGGCYQLDGNAKCINGNCCPNYNKDEKSYSETYVTNLVCNPYQPLITDYPLAYCDTISKRVIILPKIDENKMKGPCSRNSKCGPSEKHVCLFDHGRNGRCIVNPLYDPTSKYYMFVFSIMAMCTLPCITVVSFHLSGWKVEKKKKELQVEEEEIVEEEDPKEQQEMSST